MPWFRVTQILPDSENGSTIDVNSDLVEYVRPFNIENSELKLSSGELIQVKEQFEEIAKLRGIT
jgi:hypothetical protein